jgi:hypothetical protein
MTTGDETRERIAGLCAKLVAFRSALPAEEQALLDDALQGAAPSLGPAEVEGFARKSTYSFADAYKDAVKNTKVTPLETQTTAIGLRG